MRSAMATGLFFVTLSGLILGGAYAGEEKKEKKGGKVLTVSKEGLKVEGKLTEEDSRHNYEVSLEGMDLTLDLRAKVYLVKLDAGTKYVMTVKAGDDVFDPLLVVHGDGGKILAYDDDSGASGDAKFDSKLDFTAKKSATYMIHVAGMRDTVGGYTLQIAPSAAKTEETK